MGAEMKQGIDKIRIHNLRGIKDVTIDLCGNNFLILGDNGTGKSSVIDCVELFFTKSIDKLAGRQEVPLKDVIPFAGSNHERSVEIQFLGADKFTKLVYASTPVRLSPPSGYEVFFERAENRPFILHRYQLTRFIENRPAKRYEQISSLIGLEELDQIVSVWRNVVLEIRKENKQAQKESINALEEVCSWLKEPVVTDSDICKIINQKTEPMELSPLSAREEILNRQEQLRGKLTRSIELERLGTLREISSGQEKVIKVLQDFFNGYATLHKTWQAFLEKVNQIADGPFEEVIHVGRQLIEEHSLGFCPLCEEEISDQDALLIRLDARIANLHELVQLKELLEEEQKVKQKMVLRAQGELARLMFAYVKGEFSTPKTIKALKDLLSVIETKLDADTLMLDSPEGLRLDALMRSLSQETKKFQEKIDMEVNELDPTDGEQIVLTLMDFLARADEKWTDWEVARQDAENLQHKFTQLEFVFKRLVDIRNIKIQEILDSLQKEFVRQYNLLHPGEGHKAIKILMDENKHSSASLSAEFSGVKEMHPLGLYSEGHLDSMGLCIFLAFIKKFNTGLNLIILDDVLTSIDAGHRMKVAKLIASEFKDYQLIITTHDELWANELATVFKNDNMQLKTIRMNPWKLQDGATYSDFVEADWDFYRDEIISGRKQDAVAATGRSLEKFLFTMRKNLHLAIPATFDERYTLGHLYAPFFKWVNKKKINRPDMPDFNDHLALLESELDDYWRFRNWSGAHYNDWGEKISSDEALIFVETVEDLVNSLRCPSCSSLVVYDKPSNIIRCPSCKITPSSKAEWLYKTDWKKQAARLKGLQHIPDMELREIELAKSAFVKHIKDARRKFKLRVLATTNNEYGLLELYDSYVFFLKENPRESVENWDEMLSNSVDDLNTFITSEREWKTSSAFSEYHDDFVNIIATLTGLVECPTCSEMLSFDTGENIWFCLTCDKNESINNRGAYWLVE